MKYTGPQDIFDFTGYKEVKVRAVDSEMVDAEPNCCIDNSLALQRLDDSLEIVQGFARIGEHQHGFFHFWNYDPDYDVYYDCSPVKNLRYYIKGN
jgi:hypothetical protein